MYLDSPFEHCPLCNEYVLMDQTCKECQQEHHCKDVQCPLKQYFLGVDFEQQMGTRTETSDKSR